MIIFTAVMKFVIFISAAVCFFYSVGNLLALRHVYWFVLSSSFFAGSYIYGDFMRKTFRNTMIGPHWEWAMKNRFFVYGIPGLMALPGLYFGAVRVFKVFTAPIQ